jgi:hypothetical protein
LKWKHHNKQFIIGRGIRSGPAFSSPSVVGNLRILDGNITALNLDKGTGIGTGGGIQTKCNSHIELLSIHGGRMTAHGELIGIGCAVSCAEVKSLILSGNTVLIASVNVKQVFISASSITLSNALLIFTITHLHCSVSVHRVSALSVL